MKKLIRNVIFTFVTFCLVGNAFAQPANDNCVNAILLIANAPCTNGTTAAATIEGGETKPCAATLVTQTVWYKFVANNTSMNVTVTNLLSAGCHLASAVWDNGICLPATALACKDITGPTNITYNLTTLTIGNTYLISIAYKNGGPCGPGQTFCVSVSAPVFTSIAANPANPVFDANDVSYLNKDTAITVGTNGMVWRSTDGGFNWSAISTFTSTTNNNSVIAKDNYICIAGDLGTTTFSSNKGISWANATPAKPTINYHGVHFADTTFGVSVGDSGNTLVYHWVGGLGWASKPTGLNPKLNAVAAYKTSASVFTDGNAIAVGDSGIIATYAAGSWTSLTHTLTADINGIYLFPDHVTTIAVGDGGLIMRSPDFGNNWNILNSGTNEKLNDISEGRTPNEIIAVGDSGVMYVSADTGLTFTRYTVGSNTTNLKGVSAKNPRGSFGGSGSTLRTMVSDTANLTFIGDTLLCPGNSFKTAINLKGMYGTTNLVSLQLSDSSGSFVSPLVIGTKLHPLLPNDSITGTIPANAKPSLLYQIRISTSDPNIFSDTDPTTLTVYANPTGASVQLNVFDVFINSQSGCTYQWYYNNSIMPGATDTLTTTIGNGNYKVIITNSNGCSISSNTFNYTTTSINYVANATKFSVSPNPASNMLNVKVPDNLSDRMMHLYNALGSRVHSENVKPGMNRCNISDLEPGMYFLVIDSFTSKVVVVK